MEEITSANCGDLLEFVGRCNCRPHLAVGNKTVKGRDSIGRDSMAESRVSQRITSLLSEALARRRLADHLRQNARRGFGRAVSSATADRYAAQLDAESAELERQAKELADQVIRPSFTPVMMSLPQGLSQPGEAGSIEKTAVRSDVAAEPKTRASRRSHRDARVDLTRQLRSRRQ
jgi:hypothetical protein